MTDRPVDVYAPHDWKPEERPTLPGSPSTPNHPAGKRVAYLLVGLLVAITGSLGNALVTANLPYIQGYLGAYSPEVAWLPAAYVMTNVSMNLVLVKFRQQFGLRTFTEAFLLLYALVTFAHLFVNDLNSAIAVRAAHGMVGAALNSLGLYYMIQAFPAKWRLKALVLGLGTSQLALPIARVVSIDLLQIAEWRGLYLFELGLAVMSMGCVLALKLPPSDRSKNFEKLDFLTFALLSVGVALLCAVLSLGRIDWWLEAPWIGWSLAAAIPLIIAGLAIEHMRSKPLLNTRWLGSAQIVRLFLAVLLIRIVLSEQGTGAVGFLQALNLGYEQIESLYWVILLGSVCGLVASAMTIDPLHLIKPIVISLGMMAIGAFMDSHATNVTRPANMYISQFLLAFGGIFFFGPTLVFALRGVLVDPRNLVSFSVMFGMVQNVGGLVGAAALGTFEIVREKFHSSQLVEHLTLINPQVASSLSGNAAGYARLIADPGLRTAQGVIAIGAQATREATILAYNDVFLAIAVLAVLTMLWLVFRGVWLRLGHPVPAPTPAPASPAPSSATLASTPRS